MFPLLHLFGMNHTCVFSTFDPYKMDEVREFPTFHVCSANHAYMPSPFYSCDIDQVNMMLPTYHFTGRDLSVAPPHFRWGR